MIIQTNADVHSLVKAFENRTITKAEWTHQAHLVVGLYYCRTLPFVVAKTVMRDGICRLNDIHGTPNADDSGYHETLTVFWLKRIWNYIDRRPAGTDIAVLANELIERYSDPELPLRYYSREYLFSVSARHDYYPPNLPARTFRSITSTLLVISPL